MIDNNPFTNGNVLPFMGVVEDTSDPLQANRVRVRAIGFYPEQSEGGVPTRDLPWAHVGLPTTASGVSGIGSTHGLKNGSWVFGYFLDGRDAQHPIVLNSFAGSPGFNASQTEAINSGQAIPTQGVGGLGGSFQTMLASVAGSIGASSKFGAIRGGLMSLSNLLKSDDALNTLFSFTQPPTQGYTPPIQSVLDSTQAANIKSGSYNSSMGARVSSSMRQTDTLLNVLKAGGAKIPGAPGQQIFDTAQFGQTGSGQPSAESTTVNVQVDYDKLFESVTGEPTAVIVSSTNTPKISQYPLSAIQKDLPNSKAYVISQTGQIVKLQGKGDNSPTIKVAGSPTTTVEIMLVGGRQETTGKATLDSLYTQVQLQVLEKLTGAIIRKFPAIVITGASSLTGTPMPGFDVDAWVKQKWSKNSNSGKIPGDGDQTSITKPTESGSEIVEVTNTGSTDYGVVEDKSYLGSRRGFNGGMSYPDPRYASRKYSDVPAAARVNSYTVGGSSGGSPEKMYVEKLDEVGQHSFSNARPGDTLEARSIPTQWKVPKFEHGGEYGQTHVLRSTEGGHQILMDDTSGRQKIELLHSTGSMMQIHADGSGVFYVKKDNYEVVLGDKNVGVNGSMNLSVGGDMKISVKGNLVYDVGGDLKYNVSGSRNEFVRADGVSVVEGARMDVTKKGHSERVAVDKDTAVGGKMTTVVSGAMTTDVKGNRSDVARGEYAEYVAGNHTMLVQG